MTERHHATRDRSRTPISLDVHRAYQWIALPYAWVAVSLLATMAYLMIEATVHWVYFGATDPLIALFSYQAHELWMRSFSIVMIWLIVILLSRAIELHAKILSDERAYRERMAYSSHSRSSATEAEHRALAFRLHEDVAQDLSAGLLFMHSIDVSTLGPRDTNALEQAKKALDQALEKSCDVAVTLSPPNLGDYGLDSALDTLIERLRHTTGHAIRSDLQLGDVPMDQATTMTTFTVVTRILEAATTCSSGSEITVRTSLVAGQIRVDIGWHGVPAPDLVHETERMRIIGGHLTQWVTLPHCRVGLAIPAMA